MRTTRVLISGASIAGPALAFWLSRHGYAVTLVERASAPRRGGQAVDFKGEAHRNVLARMGILDRVRERQTGTTDLSIVDERNNRLATIPGEFTGGDLEIRRGDLANILHEHTVDDCEYLFGDTITDITETEDHVRVAFARSPSRCFDLVIGADGIHSRVRQIAFGPEERFVRFLGYYYAVVGLREPESAPRPATGSVYCVPNRYANIDGPEDPAMFVFASEELDYDREDIARQKRILAEAYADVGWRLPEFLEKLPHAKDFYLDSLSRVELDHYFRGRVALLGDAAYGNTLGGFGTGLAVVGAYILAGELAAAEGNHRVAFLRYESKMHRYAKIARTGNAGPFLAPPTRARIRLRNWTFAFSLPLRMMMKLSNYYATDIELPDYPDPVRTR